MYAAGCDASPILCGVSAVRKAVQEIQQFVMRFGPTSYSGQTTPALPQATEIARSFIIIDKILFK